MSYSWDSLSLSSCALPGTYLPSLLPQSLLFSVSTFSLSVLHHTHTLVTSSLSLDLKIHTWSSLCLLSPRIWSFHPRVLSHPSPSIIHLASLDTSNLLLTFHIPAILQQTWMKQCSRTLLRSPYRVQNLPLTAQGKTALAEHQISRFCPTEAQPKGFVTLCDQLLLF